MGFTVADQLPLLVSPRHWAHVEAGVSRGGYPLLRNFNFLRRLDLKTIVSLIPDDPTYDLKTFCEASGINHFHIRVDKFKGDPTLLPNDCNTALEALLNADNHPVYIHCLDGRQITGHLIMLLRKVQLWSEAAALAELFRYCREEPSKEEASLFTEFTGPLSLTSSLPSWLLTAVQFDAEGKLKRHPSVRLKHIVVPAPVPNKDHADLNSPSNGSFGGGNGGGGKGGLGVEGAAGGGAAAEAAGPQSRYINLDAVTASKSGSQLHLPTGEPTAAAAVAPIVAGSSLSISSDTFALNIPTVVADVRLVRMRPSNPLGGGNRRLPRRYSTNSIRGKPRDSSSPR